MVCLCDNEINPNQDSFPDEPVQCNSMSLGLERDKKRVFCSWKGSGEGCWMEKIHPTCKLSRVRRLVSSASGGRC